MARGPVSGRRWIRAGGVVLSFTAVLTAAFVGILGLLRGSVTDTGSRLPLYTLAFAVTFVAAIYLFSRYGADARTVLFSGLGFGAVAFVLFGLGAEGVVYAVRSPAAVFGSHLVIYFLSAGMIVTGVGFWLVTHWRELIGDPFLAGSESPERSKSSE
ncbi:hypothetical protein [Halobaculum roseum]|uniref:Uncharacterized protein n=1 Tax=Halobaculum roseum TaxID=2175149 RepID=A0ABD5MTJ3_9EURY|nr:hypothetical protein [Halobaculum roseum]QZY02059.1 hypothetical protein K6T36_12170 [Halobaculum roseum]